MRFRISNLSKKSSFLPSEQQIEALKRRKYKALRSEYYRTRLVKAQRKSRESFEKIRLHDLFEFAALEEPEKPKKHIFREFFRTAKIVIKKLGAFILMLLKSIGSGIIFIAKKLVPKRAPRSIPLLCGALCAAIIISVLSAFTVGASLLSRYFLPYDKFVIPNLIGADADEATELYSDRIEFSIKYVYSSQYDKNTVISQYPSDGIIKKIYASSEPCSMSLVVSKGIKTYEVGDFVGISEREAIVTLRKNEIITDIVKEFSDTVESGRIISTSPQKNSILEAGDRLTLVVSLGKKINKATVPDLYNLTESGARQIIEERGLVLGSITYAASLQPAGRVIAQSVPPAELLDEGSTINLTVSAGEGFSSHLVPDLYGLTLSEAKEKLRAVGLVLGNVFSVSSGAPSGTIVAQSPIPSSVIISSVTSVDIYISS